MYWNATYILPYLIFLSIIVDFIIYMFPFDKDNLSCEYLINLCNICLDI